MENYPRKPLYFVVGNYLEMQKIVQDDTDYLQERFGNLVATRIDRHTWTDIYEFEKAVFRFASSDTDPHMFRFDRNGTYDPINRKLHIAPVKTYAVVLAKANADRRNS